MFRIEYNLAEIVAMWPSTKIAIQICSVKKTWLPGDVAYRSNKNLKNLLKPLVRIDP